MPSGAVSGQAFAVEVKSLRLYTFSSVAQRSRVVVSSALEILPTKVLLEPCTLAAFVLQVVL